MARILSPAQAWSEKDHRLLRRVYAKKSWPELCAIFRRSQPAISSRAKILNILRGNRRLWTAEEDAILRQLYATTAGEDLAARFGCAIHQVYCRARRLGLRQDPAFRLERTREAGRRGVRHPNMVARRYPKGHVPANKGLRRPGYAPGRMRETQFKKGQRPRTWLPVGTVVTDTDGYLKRKIAEDRPGKGGSSQNWEFVHRRTWEDAHGPIPRGHKVVFRDGNKQNTSPENLELVSYAGMMRRNSIHNLPQPLKEVVYLKGALNHSITMRKRKGIHASKEQAVRPARPSVRNSGSAPRQRREIHGHQARRSSRQRRRQDHRFGKSRSSVRQGSRR